MQHLQLISVTQLAALLGRSADALRKAIQRNPRSLPAPLSIPGSRQLRWRVVDVERWMAAHSADQALEAIPDHKLAAREARND